MIHPKVGGAPDNASDSKPNGDKGKRGVVTNHEGMTDPNSVRTRQALRETKVKLKGPKR